MPSRRVSASSVLDLGKQGEIVRTVVPVFSPDGNKQVEAAIAVSYYVPQSLAAKSEEIRAGLCAVPLLADREGALKLSYRLGFLTVTLALLLAAIWVALRVAAGIYRAHQETGRRYGSRRGRPVGLPYRRKDGR